MSFKNWAAIATTAERLIIANITKTELWQADNITPLATAAFPAPPDEIYLYRNGKAVTLTGEDCREVYDHLMSALGRAGANEMSGSHYGYSIDCVENSYLCFELRYHQRQFYQPTDTPPKNEWATPFELLYHNRPYDAVLFVVDATENEITSAQSKCKVRIGLCSPSNLFSSNMASQPSLISPDFIKSLTAYF